MPLPKPNSGETHEDFNSRCMSNAVMKAEYKDTDQRYAVCQSLWGKRMNEQDSVRLYGKFTRLDEEERMVYGYASTEAVDTFDTVFDAPWWPYAIEGYKQTRSLSAMHDRPNIGSVPILEVRPKGLWIGARVDDLDEWKLVQDKTYGGFSIEFFAYDSRQEVFDGREVRRYLKFVLTDITIGNAPSNKEASFQLIGRLQTEKDAPWDFDWSKDAQAIVDLFGFKGLKEATLYQNPNGALDDITTYRLPIAKVSGGKLTVYRLALRAAMAVINGARAGEEDYTRAEKEGLYTKIKKVYQSFNEVAPELRLQSTNEPGGIKMSKLGDAISELMKKATGKDVTDDLKKDIVALESRLDTEKDADKIPELVEALETRLAKLETASETDESKKRDEEAAKKVDEFLKKAGERLDVLETGASGSKQPDDKGVEVTGVRTAEQKAEAASTGMNQFIRAASGAVIPGEGNKEGDKEGDK